MRTSWSTGAVAGALITYLVIANAGSAAQPRVFEIDGWCLQHSGENLEFWPDPDRPRGVPEFRVPFDFPLPSFSADPGETGLIVSYSKSPTFSRRSQNNPRGGRGRAGCDRVPLGHGLSQLTGEELPDCSVRESFDWQTNWYEPTDPFDVLDGVFLRCGRGPDTRNCHMTGLLPNGWEASVIVPLGHVDEWKSAARAARDYFESYLTECKGD